jgi:hypothetical protein
MNQRHSDAQASPVTSAIRSEYRDRFPSLFRLPSSWLYESLNHPRKTRLIFYPNGFELHTYSISSLYVPHRSAGSDCSVLDKKMQLNRRVDSACFPGVNKEASYAQIVHSRGIFRSVAPPESPNTVRSFNALVVSS